MCHTSVLENEQIDKCIENGMPHKIIKTIKYTMRKRAAIAEEDHLQDHKQQQQKQDQNITASLESKTLHQDHLKMVEKIAPTVSKCPFGHGRFLSSSSFSSSTSSSSSSNSSTPLMSTTSIMPMASNTTTNFEFPNLNERFHQITQLSTNIAADNSNVSNNSNNITNLSGHFEETKMPAGNVYNGDIIAKGTQLSKQFAYNMQQAIRRLQSSKIYTLLTKTTQPAHIIAICTLSFVLLTVWPELIYGKTSSSSPSDAKHTNTQQQQQLFETTRHSQDMSVRKNDMLALIAYLGAFSTHFGAQIWMTFVSGLSLYFSLPRHMFGQCQQILFPKYFAMNAALSITMLILFVKFFLNTWTLAKCIQLGSLALSGAIEVLVRLYLAPPLLRLMQEKYKIEGTVGSGKEIGSLVQGDLVQCPHYQRIHKTFRRIHMTVAIGNIITMLASCLHLYFIAGQLQISIVA